MYNEEGRWHHTCKAISIRAHTQKIAERLWFLRALPFKDSLYLFDDPPSAPRVVNNEPSLAFTNSQDIFDPIVHTEAWWAEALSNNSSARAPPPKPYKTHPATSNPTSNQEGLQRETNWPEVIIDAATSASKAASVFPAHYAAALHPEVPQEDVIQWVNEKIDNLKKVLDHLKCLPGARP